MDFKKIEKTLSINNLKENETISISITQGKELNFAWGCMYEWGLPPGHYGRDILIRIAAEFSSKHWVLWSHSDDNSTPNHDAWIAHNINIDKFRFACSKDPIEDLKAAILSPIFKFIVLDGASNLNNTSLAFLHHKAKKLKKIIFIIQPFYLDSKRGSIWCKKRININHDIQKRVLQLKSIKGYEAFDIPVNGNK